MRKFSVMLLAMALLFGMVSVSNALLIDRGGGLIYDTEQDITWLQDANYAMTSGYDDDGRMNWYDAMTWSENLVYGGYDNWRLPVDPGGYEGEMTRLYYADDLIHRDDLSIFFNLQFTYWTGSDSPWGHADTHAVYFIFNGNHSGGNKLTALHYAWAVRDGDVAPVPEPATIDIDPDTLNLKSKGKWITCYIELPEEYDVADIDVSMVAIMGISAVGGDATEVNIPAEPFPTEIGDYNGNGILDLMVKFDRQLVQDVVPVGAVEITVSGSTIGEVDFQGTDTLLIIDKGREHIDDKNHGSVVY